MTINREIADAIWRLTQVADAAASIHHGEIWGASHTLLWRDCLMSPCWDVSQQIQTVNRLIPNLDELRAQDRIPYKGCTNEANN